MAHQGSTHIPPCPTVEEPNLLIMVVNYSADMVTLHLHIPGHKEYKVL